MGWWSTTAPPTSRPRAWSGSSAARKVEGNPTRVKNAAFGMEPEFTIGQASGSIDGFGISFDASYGDTHAFEWAS